jgi:hypothetical protein
MMVVALFDSPVVLVLLPENGVSDVYEWEWNVYEWREGRVF